MQYFTADLHFNHKNIVKYCDRPVEQIEDHNTWILSHFNNFKKGDILYLLGDIWFKPTKEQVEEFFKLLEEQGVLLYIVVGNHDEAILQMLYEVYRAVFKKHGPTYIQHYFTLRFKQEYPFNKIVLSHYPFESWDGSYHGKSIHLHGHSHGFLKNKLKYRYDIGIDVCHRLFSMEDICQMYSDDSETN